MSCLIGIKIPTWIILKEFLDDLVSTAKEIVQNISMILEYDWNNKINGNQKNYIALINGNQYMLTINAFNLVTKTTIQV